ncbi:ABC transporter substrate-binding protein [Actinocatenispora sera]|uniref:Peptide ABC transporter substrate-binding protein n=1 Tax=Actinocatenispora sera TaxID=390989 RepID=A0A810L6G0_9ACTN|nr:ABC transporter substrate-binding protein [Actinocatenispora sera]BCJ31094.1 peptide ABC transporter substrate-binding protein [Actinocatenispora sera]
MRRRSFAALAATAVGAPAVGGVLAGCAPSPRPGSRAAGATLTVATTTDVVNFNPLVGNSRTDYWITDLMYPRLLTIDEAGNKQPWLAVRYGYHDPKTGYYRIRDDVRWSDGKPVTAADVAFTINAIKRDKPAGNTTFGQLTNVARASAASATEVLLHLSKPDQTVLREVGFWMNVVPAHVFGKVSNVATFANTGDWVGCGPYTLVSAAKGQAYTLERTEPYPWAPGGKPSLARVVFRVYPDINTEILALRSGEVDLIANTLPPAQVDVLRHTTGITVRKVPGLGYAHLAYNMKHKPLDKLAVRQALAHAVDYAAIRRVVLQGQAVSTHSSPIAPVLTAYADPSMTEYRHDPAHARRLLRQAGYHADARGRFGLSLRMIYSLQDAVTAQWASMVASDAAKAGITITLQGMDRNTYLAKTDAGDYDIYAGNFAIMDDPVTNMALTYLPGGAINYSKVDDPALSKLITDAQVATPDEQRELVAKAAHLVRDNVYDNVVYMQNFYVAHRTEWTGFVAKPSELLTVVDPASLARVRTRS